MTTTGIELSGVPYEATQVAEWLTNGKPELGWRGDPRLELRIGVLKFHKTGYDARSGRYRRAGEVAARAYEVWRHNEDGTQKRILQRKITEWHDIIPALVQLDPRTPGHEDTMTKVDRENKAADKAATDRVREAKGEAIEHLWSIVQEREHGRLTHRQVGGSDERADRNLAKP